MKHIRQFKSTDALGRHVSLQPVMGWDLDYRRLRGVRYKLNNVFNGVADFRFDVADTLHEKVDQHETH